MLQYTITSVHLFLQCRPVISLVDLFLCLFTEHYMSTWDIHSHSGKMNPNKQPIEPRHRKQTFTSWSFCKTKLHIIKHNDEFCHHPRVTAYILKHFHDFLLFQAMSTMCHPSDRNQVHRAKTLLKRQMGDWWPKHGNWVRIHYPFT